MVITAKNNTWSHQRRKRRKQKLEGNAQSDDINQNKKRKVEGKSEKDENIHKSKTNSTNSDGSHEQSSMGNSCQATESRKRKHSGELDDNETKVPKIECASGIIDRNNMSTTEMDDAREIEDCQKKAAFNGAITVIKTGKNVDCSLVTKEQNPVSEQVKSGASELMQGSEIASKDEECILKCNLSVKLIEDEKVAIEMAWIDGTCRESMNQVLQYFKNQLQKIIPE